MAYMNSVQARGIRGYGYQWRVTPAVCRASAIEAGDLSPDCGSTLWFWLLAAGALGWAVLAPVRRVA